MTGKQVALCLLLMMSTGVYASLVKGIDGHTQGDVIAIDTDEQIANWCDFSKQIVVTNNHVLCVFNGKSSK